MLEDYATSHGFTNLVHFTDDGWSGASFDRPAWNRLVEGVKNGEITTVIAKDLSRIGRDHLQVGFFTDILFREKDGQEEKIAMGDCAINLSYEDTVDKEGNVVLTGARKLAEVAVETARTAAFFGIV